jgi:hypothetical protein
MILVEIMQVSCSCCYYMWHFVQPRFANAPTASPSSSMTTAHAKPCIHAVSLPILHMHLLVLLVVAGTPECVQAALVMPWGNSLTCPTSPSASHTCSKVRTHLGGPADQPDQSDHSDQPLGDQPGPPDLSYNTSSLTHVQEDAHRLDRPDSIVQRR